MKFNYIPFIASVALFATASMSGQQSHTWVSGSGSDANPCTFASPCATFTGALANTNAGGLITAKDAGDFGAVSIAQSVTIDGNNLGSIMFSGGMGVNIAATANVTLQNLTINGLGFGSNGISVEYGGIVTVDNCKIVNFTYYGIYFQYAGNLTVENSLIESFNSGYSGIHISDNAVQKVVVRDTVIQSAPASSTYSGFSVDSQSGLVTSSLQNVTIMGAGAGAVVSFSGDTQITDSVITQSGYGVYANSGATISVANSLIILNTIGVCSNASSKIRLDNNDIYDNITAIDNCGGIVKTSTTNKTSGTISIPASDVSDSVTF